jgi:hypothetical protein
MFRMPAPALRPPSLNGCGAGETLRWREVGSNFRFPNRSASVFEKAVLSPVMV